jgi:hypothetical protein
MHSYTSKVSLSFFLENIPFLVIKDCVDVVSIDGKMLNHDPKDTLYVGLNFCFC